MQIKSEITLRATAPSPPDGLLALDAAEVGIEDEGCIDIRGNMNSESFCEAVLETQRHRLVPCFIGRSTHSNSRRISCRVSAANPEQPGQQKPFTQAMESD